MSGKSIAVPAHAVTGVLALAVVSTFFVSSTAALVSGDAGFQHDVKLAILWGLLGLVPCLAATGAAGASLAKKRRDTMTATKYLRMKVVAVIGLGILVPCAVYLGWRALQGQGIPYPVQYLELAAGACNITLLTLNLRDGLKLRGKRLSA
ncbi:hypothetical protein HH303_06400 [Rhodospirillaceae bacterium KN72]|uniref:Uncharacterized protein n=1 Tax=Pacificispira spongiicola TaxID=2729598 RepID=A0A7Y0DYT3_9PROT|nr:hypothetical protein [Pacificispira spongiicola]NMM44099.1 hypothetical protein [Pacificispira spongiicola]